MGNGTLSGCRNVCMYVCMVITYSKSKDQSGKVANFFSWSAGQGKFIFSCPCSRLRIWCRETGSAVPFRFSLFILHTQFQSGAYSRDSPDFHGGVHLHIPTYAIGSSPEFIGSRNCVPMSFTAESPPA